MSTIRPLRRGLARAVGAGAALVLAAGVAQTVATTTSQPASANARVVGDALFTSAPSVAGRSLAMKPTSGRQRLVGLRTALLPRTAHGQRLTFNLFPGEAATGTVEHRSVVRHSGGIDYTVWTGRLDTPLSNFTIVRAGSAYRMELTSIAGSYVVERAAGGAYWVSRPDARPVSAPGTTDEVRLSVPAATEGRASAARLASQRHASQRLAPRRLHDSGHELDVLFGYNNQVKAQAGGRDPVLAYAATVVTETNTALAQSGDRGIHVRMVGLAKTSTHKNKSFDTNLTWLRLPHDGHYDGLVKARNRTHADVVHLFLPGQDARYCGLGYLPLTPREARPDLGFSQTSYSNCAVNHSVTHELGHNMGADHDRYPTVSHYSKLPYAAGKVNTRQGWMSIMAYPNAILDKHPAACCTYLLYYSNPKLHYNGAKVGGKRQNNAKAIRKVEVQTARYKLGRLQHTKIRVSGSKRVGHVIRVHRGRWASDGHRIHFTYRWKVGGHVIRHKRGPHLRIKAKWWGHPIKALVIGHAKTYRAVTAKHKVTGIKKAHFRHTTKPRLKGKAKVGHVLHVRLRHFRPHPQRVKVIWYRNGHKIKHHHGTHYRLRAKDKHKTLKAKVIVRTHGYFQVVKHTRKVHVR